MQPFSPYTWAIKGGLAESPPSELLHNAQCNIRIVGKRTLTKYGHGDAKGWVVSGIHDLDRRKIAVSNTSATVVIHEIGHFVSCSFQKVNGINLTQTSEWQKIYERERNKFCQPNSFSQAGDTYAATSANEFFAECFQQYYLTQKTLKSHCPLAYNFVRRTMNIDFPKIAGVNW